MNKKNIENAAFRIKELRTSHNYTMEKLAQMVGVSKSTIAKWENGYVENMRQDKVKKLAVIFNVKPTYIMGYDEEESSVNSVDELTDKEKHFIECFSRLSEEQQKLVDGLMSSWLSKQESDPASRD